MKDLKIKKGLTLLEAIITSVIAAIVLAGAASYIIFSSDSYKRTIAQTQINDALTLIEGSFREDVQKGAEVQVLNSNSKLEIVDSYGAITQTYEFKNNRFLKNGKNLAGFVNGDFTGKFIQKTTKKATLKISVSIKKNGTELENSGTISYISKCRNRSL